MQDFTPDRPDRNLTQATSAHSAVPPTVKRLGSYLVEAGLLSPGQINVILTDQQSTGMRFGEIAVARGWLKEQTIEWIIEKVVMPERQSIQAQANLHARTQSQKATSGSTQARRPQPLDRQSPDRQSAQSPLTATTGSTANSLGGTIAAKPFVRREVPISKPLPSVTSADHDVYWVG